MTPATSPLQPNLRTYAGRLLTMAGVPSDLVAGQVLQVETRTVVTPEVRDYLRRQRVELQRGVGGAAANNRSSVVAEAAVGGDGRTLQVWWHGTLESPFQTATRGSSTRGSSTRWLGQIDPRVEGQLLAVACSRELADQVVTQMHAAAGQWSGPTQLVMSPRPWEVQRELAERHGAFAWCVMSSGPLGWEQAQSSAAKVLVALPPLTSWIVRRWLTLVQPQHGRGTSNGQRIDPTAKEPS